MRRRHFMGGTAAGIALAAASARADTGGTGA